MAQTEKEYFELLNTLIPKWLEESKCPGANVGLIINGALVTQKSFGYANIEEKIHFDPDHIFQLASISKAIAAWGIMKLVEQGKLELDAPVEQYLTRWHLPKDYEISLLKKYCPNIGVPDQIFNHDGVTVRGLLSHTAGLSLPGYLGLDISLSTLPSIEDSLSGNTASGEGEVRAAHLPKTKFSYSGGGYTLLQLLVEEVTGQKFADFMEKEILVPLGMKNSSYQWRDDLQSKTAVAYNVHREKLPNFQFTALAAAGCYASVEDLAIFVVAGMPGPNGEKAGRGILKPETIKLMHTEVMNIDSAEGIDVSIGLGHFLTNYKGVKVVHHAGGNQGWKNLMLMAPQTSNGFIILTNGEGGELIVRLLLSKWSELQSPGN